LGNNKPELIVNIERALWVVLLDIAMGRKELFSAVRDFINGLPWDELEMVETSVSEYFVDSEHLFVENNNTQQRYYSSFRFQQAHTPRPFIS